MKENAEKQELTERQKKNWVTAKQFQKAVKQSVKNARLSLLKDPNDESTTYQDYLNVQEALILQFYWLYPLRNDLVDTYFVAMWEADGEEVRVLDMLWKDYEARAGLETSVNDLVMLGSWIMEGVAGEDFESEEAGAECYKGWCSMMSSAALIAVMPESLL